MSNDDFYMVLEVSCSNFYNVISIQININNQLLDLVQLSKSIIEGEC